MNNPYLDGMVKAAAIFPPVSTLRTMSRASGETADKAAYHLGLAHEHSTHLNGLADIHHWQTEEARSIASDMYRKGTTPERIQDLQHVQKKLAYTKSQMDAHNQGLRDHTEQYHKALGISPSTQYKDVGGPVNGVRPDAVEGALKTSRNPHGFFK